MAAPKQRVGRQVGFFPLLPRPVQLRSRDVPISDGERQIVDWLTLSLIPALEHELRYLRLITSTAVEGNPQMPIVFGTSEETFTPP